MTIVFILIKNTIGLRVSREEEITGLDFHEHGLETSYADFMPIVGTQFKAASEEVAVSKAVPIPEPHNTNPDAPMKKVVIVTKQSKFEALKSAIESVGITGMTVTQVLGCGMQKGQAEYYRGVPVEAQLLPKVKVEIVICKVPLDTLLDAIKKALYTGNIGDGKVFIYDVENVVKIRTSEEGYDALQDEE